MKILEGFKDIELKYVNLMPIEMFQAAFKQEIVAFESRLVNGKIKDALLKTQTVDDEFNEVVDRYELATRNFQERITKSYAVPAPPLETLHLNLADALSEPTNESRPYLKNLPPNLPPSRIFAEYLKHDEVPNIYRQINPNDGLCDEEILALYNGSLDLYFLANFMYGFKRKALREAASKNDLLDVIHTAYLFNHKSLIVSNDRIFDSILPEINRISVEEYRNLI